MVQDRTKGEEPEVARGVTREGREEQVSHQREWGVSRLKENLKCALCSQKAKGKKTGKGNTQPLISGDRLVNKPREKVCGEGWIKDAELSNGCFIKTLQQGLGGYRIQRHEWKGRRALERRDTSSPKTRKRERTKTWRHGVKARPDKKSHV